MQPEIKSSLRQRTAHMVHWTLIGFGATQLIRLVSNLAMTRLLAPEAFGVMSLAYALVIALAMLSDVGIEPALVQRRSELTPRYVNTLWTFQVLQGAILGVLMLVGAAATWAWQHTGPARDIAGSTFSSPDLPGVMMLLALSPVLGGMLSTKNVTATRDMNVSRTMLLQLAESVIAAVVTLGLAAAMRTVYALPVGVIVGNAFRTWVSHRHLAGDSNFFCWDRSALRELHKFGKWILLSTAMTFVVNGGDRLLLGSMLSSREMGLYAIAFLLASTAQGLLQRLNSVGLPLFSEVARERPNDLPAIFHRIRLRVDLLSLFIAGGLMGAAPGIVALMYDKRYAGAGEMLFALAPLVVATRFDLVSACWTAMGLTHRLTILSLVRMIVLVIGLPLGFALAGPVGAAWGVSLAALSNHVVGWWFMSRSGLLMWRKELLPLPIGLVGYGAGKLAVALQQALHNAVS